MRAYIRVLRQRVRDSRYVVDEAAVAEAVLARAKPRRVNADRADVRKHLARLEQQIKQFRGDNRAAAAPARSVRRATARRASTRRHAARSRQSDTTARIIEFLTRHPQSTAGDLARSLNLDPESVSTSLNQLANAGDIKKHAHGFSTQ
jgi:predicted transcriptional regulator